MTIDTWPLGLYSLYTIVDKKLRAIGGRTPPCVCTGVIVTGTYKNDTWSKNIDSLYLCCHFSDVSTVENKLSGGMNDIMKSFLFSSVFRGLRNVISRPNLPVYLLKSICGKSLRAMTTTYYRWTSDVVGRNSRFIVFFRSKIRHQ